MRKAVLLILVSMSSLAMAQTLRPDTTYNLSGVEIYSERLKTFTPGIKIHQFDSAILLMNSNTSLASLISDYSPVFMRSYGTGGLSTLSIRGTQSTQSGVFWNGFNLMQSNSGMTDLSVIPSIFFNDIEIQYGGSSALYGSGLIGGSLCLSNTPDYSRPLRAIFSAGTGSTGNSNLSTRIDLGKGKFALSSSAFGDYSLNRYRYTDLSGDKKRLDHATGTTAGLMNQFDYFLSDHHHLSAGLWWQFSDREIPPTLVMSRSDQQQTSASGRYTLQYSYLANHSKIHVRSAVFSDYLRFVSPVADIDARYHIYTYALESEWRQQLTTNSRLDVGANSRLVKADIPYYEKIRYQRELALYASLTREWKAADWKAALNVRKDFIEDTKAPLCPSVSAEGRIFTRFRLRVAVSRNFRIPTMNDRYWQPGGNPELEPESSFNQEIGLSYNGKSSDSRRLLEINLTPYSMVVKNMIQWASVNSSLWVPANVEKVWSRGIESYARVTLNQTVLQSSLQLNYTYTASSYQTGDELAGKQLIYVPVHRWNLMSSFRYRSWDFLVSGNLTGKRYTLKDNSDELPAYLLIDLKVGKSFRVGKHSMILQVQGKNLLNTRYQVILYYPEPGTTLSVNLILKISSNHNETH